MKLSGLAIQYRTHRGGLPKWHTSLCGAIHAPLHFKPPIPLTRYWKLTVQPRHNPSIKTNGRVSWVYRHWNRHAPRGARKRNLRSKIWWFTEFCNSHYVSHFAAFFIVAWAKISVAKSCKMFLVFSTCLSSMKEKLLAKSFESVEWFKEF